MIGQISWREYWTVMIILIALYYIVIGFIFYRKDFTARFTSNSITDEPGVQENQVQQE